MRLAFALFCLLPLAASACAAPARQGLTVGKGGVLLHEGKPFRGIGVNYFDAFCRTFGNPEDTGYDKGFAALAEARIPFCRISACGYWPAEQALYTKDKAEFFRRFDAVVRSAEKHGIGLVPSLFWNVATVPDLVGEPVGSWGDPKSKTQAYMRRFVRDVVTRYRNSPAIWGWEFGNEFNLGASLPNASEHRPPIVPDMGTPTTRSAKDEWSYETIRAAFAAFGREVRKHDPYRVISTGDGFPRESAWHNWKEKAWTRDTAEQEAEMLAGDNPGPIDVLSVHAYGDCADDIRRCAEVGRRIGKPLFVGEFGSPGAREKSEKEFRAILAAIEESGAPFAALWVYDYNGQDDTWNVTSTNPRSYQLQAIVEANGRMRQSGVGSRQSGRATTESL